MLEKHTQCYLCNSNENIAVFTENEIEILKCKTCEHVFSSYVQEEHYDGYWNEEEFDLNWWDYAHREIYADFISKFLKEEKGSLLDVGCGLGFFVKTIQEKKPKWNVIGYEISKQAVKFAKTNNNLNNVYQGIVQESKIEKNSLDIITLWDVIEHIAYPQSLLKYLYSLLKEEGILFIQTPNFPIQLVKAKLKVMLRGMKEDVHYLEAKDHVNQYAEGSINNLGIICGFNRFDFHILKPITSVSGSKRWTGFIKKIYYHLTQIIWLLSFKKFNLNNTLFVTMKK